MTEAIRAAGGVVWRPGADGEPEVLLVHRPKYGDWTLPKGKLMPGETPRAAAIREVEEETGLRCRLGEPLGSVSYTDAFGRPKTVDYFAMRPLSGRFEPNEEVDRVRWVPLSDAVGTLTYDHDRTLLDGFDPSDDDDPVAPGVEPATVRFYLVRHAEAGSRHRWRGPDRDRPLSALGRQQAAALAARFDGIRIDRLVSSPFLRCVQTLEPVSAARGLPIERADGLAENAPVERAAALLASLAGQPAAACSHGDVIEALIPRLAAEGMRIEGPAEFAKASVWELRTEQGRFVEARYWPAP